MTEAARWSLPAAVLAAASALALYSLPRMGDASESRVVAVALSLDFTVTVPALVYVLLVRTGRLPWIAIVPALAIGYALAMATIPAHHAALDVMRFLAVPAELLAVGYLVLLTRKTLRGVSRSEGDFPTRLRSVARSVLGRRIPADILTTEVAILYYALRWRRPAPNGPDAFTVHREIGYFTVLIALLVLLVVEAIALHALASRWGATATWILKGLSIYAVIWLVGDYRAMTARPIRLTPARLSMRVGLRWEAEIPIERIASAEPLPPQVEKPARDTLLAALLGQPNLRVELTEPVEMIGMYGIRKTAREVWLRVDEAPRLLERLRQALPHQATGET